MDKIINKMDEIIMSNTIKDNNKKVHNFIWKFEVLNKLRVKKIKLNLFN